MVRIPPIEHSTPDQGKPPGGLTLWRVDIEPRATLEGSCLHSFTVRSAGGTDDVNRFGEPRIGRIPVEHGGIPEVVERRQCAVAVAVGIHELRHELPHWLARRRMIEKLPLEQVLLAAATGIVQVLIPRDLFLREYAADRVQC